MEQEAPLRGCLKYNAVKASSALFPRRPKAIASTLFADQKSLLQNHLWDIEP
jgi:hypothetical protein